MRPELVKELDDHMAIFLALRHDVLHSYKAGLRDEPANFQYHYRQIIRCMFASLEGLLYELKMRAILTAEVLGLPLDPVEVMLAKEKSAEIDHSGEVVIRDSFAQFKGRLRFALAFYAKIIQYPIEKIPYGDCGFRDLCETVKVRNRLVHPKSLNDLVVTDQELTTAMNGFTWFNDCSQILIEHSTNLLTSLLDDMHKQAEKKGLILS